ncbi:restriction endonuclease [Nocardia brasiliensis]|uniref:restriction endonuclease n=1 Tax=Nocardia brasiliensis TaxID=37326 RepID=UPI002453FD30|nr:restriction endonuclease [Nocardia brasiliensis]
MGRRRYRSRRRRQESTAAMVFMAGIAGVVIVARVRPAIHVEPGTAVALTVGVAVVALVAVVARIRYRRRIRARDDARTLAALRQNALSPTEFEHALAALCRRDGCRDVRVVGGAGDLGADVLARSPEGLRIALQAKRYRNGNKVGSQDVQRFGGTCFTIHQADVAAVVTTARAFTPQARAYAQAAGIALMDARGLAAWDSQTGPAPWRL